ncbi:MAG TPA: hypothetical protein VI796_04415 [Candidatus Thermoplasmatota archaeon]|nr:hypothetical protein [Candidatus Thermoplasmatota archaeon]
MRWLPLLVALAFLMAGCSSSGDSPEGIAKAAVDRLDRDQGLDGDMSGVTFRMDLTVDGPPEMEIGATGSLVAYRGDAMKMEFRFNDVSMDGEEVSQLEELLIVMFCTPDRLVVQVEGDEAWGGNDIDLETENDAGACLGDDVNEALIASSLGRIVDEMGDGMAGNFVAIFLEPEAEDEYEVKEARQDGDRIRATYLVTDEDGTHEEDVIIEDGRIVEQSLESDEDGVRTEVLLRFTYGTRTAAPSIRGADEV